MNTLAALLLTFSSLSANAQVATPEPGWSGPIVARGPLREEIENTPIEVRNYRPFHFYGNTVRRRHYRGNALPLPRDLRGVVSSVRR